MAYRETANRETTDRDIRDVLNIAAGENRKEREYWHSKLAGDLEKTAYPYDITGPQSLRKTDPGATSHAEYRFRLGEEQQAGLMKLSKGVDHTQHMIMVTAWVTLLEKYTGKKDIIVGTTIYKQKEQEQKKQEAGKPKKTEYINTELPLRITVDGDMTIKQLLLHSRETIQEANENQNYPMEVLLEELGKPVTEDDCSPLFGTAVLHGNIHDREYLTYQKPGMVLTVWREDGGGMEGRIEYDPHRYKESTVRRIHRHYQNRLEQLRDNLDKKLQDIDILTPEEKRTIQEEFNKPVGEEPPPGRTVHGQFEEQVRRTPHRAAVTDHRNRTVTYRELNRQANRQAHLLRSRGVGRETIVAQIMEPSIQQIVSHMAILKAGGAVQPIEPGTPEKRIETILRDSGTPLIITREEELREKNITALLDINARTAEVKPNVTPLRPQIKDFDGLPSPDRSRVNYEKIHKTIGCAMARHTISIQGSRGCPFNCAYCHKIWPKSNVVRSAGNIFEEIRYNYEAGARRFTFIDDVFNLKKDNSARLLEKIIRHKLDLQLFFPNGLRGDILDRETIDLMVEAGTVDMALALETASPRIQKLIRKNLNLETFRENIEYITQRYPQVILELEMIVGFPTETEEEALMTLDFLKDQKWVHFPNLHVLKIYNNTDMYRLALDNGVTPEQVERSAALAYHQLPETLPFTGSFVRQYQSRVMNEYILNKDRLAALLPYQVKILSEPELVEKYDSYLPMEIRSLQDLMKVAGIPVEQQRNIKPMQHEPCAAPGFMEKIRTVPHPSFGLRQGPKESDPGAFRILLMDLSQLYAEEAGRMLYDVIEEPLGLMYLMAYLEETQGDKIEGKIVKSRVDFETDEELREILEQFQPDLIGIRTLTYYKEFFHRTVTRMRQWGTDVPVIAGGPYATSDYNQLLMDHNVDLAVLGEGEHTLRELVEAMIDNNKQYPPEERLRDIRGIAYVEARDRERLKARNREIITLEHRRENREEYPDTNPEPVNGPDDLLYVITTSGTTGKPKGIMQEHRTLLNLMRHQTETTVVEYDTHVLQFASVAFDISPQEIYSALHAGGTLYPVTTDMKGDIRGLISYMDSRGIEIAHQPPAFLKYLFSEAESMGIFPTALKHIIAAGEQLEVTAPMRRLLGQRGIRLHNHYGPAETHVVTTLTMEPHEEHPASPTIGRPILNTQVQILDPQGRPVPIGVTGEIHITGHPVGRGYQNQPELTATKFGNNLPHSNTGPISPMSYSHKAYRAYMSHMSHPSYRTHRSDRSYKTGDLARWREDGTIEFQGRTDTQVKIRGNRIECSEIARRLASHHEIREAEVVDREDTGGEKYLCAYYTADRPQESSALREYLAHELPDYMVPSYFEALERIPVTVNGKVDRKALPLPRQKPRDSYVEPRNAIERTLEIIWQDVLGRTGGTGNADIGIDDNFFDRGGHSLKATIMIAKIHKAVDVKIPLGEIFKMPTIRALAQYIQGADKDIYAAVRPVEERDYYPVSSAQKRMYILNRLKRDNTSDNTPDVVKITGRLQQGRVQHVVDLLIRRHEPLRTGFQMEKDEPVQRIYKDVKVEIETIEASGATDKGIKGIIENFIRPFDLARPPLLRVALVKQAEDEHLLMYDMHHIIKDGTTSGIFIREFIDQYRGRNLPEPKLQYKDYTAWQTRMQETGAMKKQEDYWLRVFEGDIPRLEMPTDYPRPEVQSFEGQAENFHFDEELTAKLKAQAAGTGTTLYMVLMAIYTILLSKYSGQDDHVVGTPAAGRPHADLENMIGMFVNTLPMRNRPEAGKTYSAYLQEVKNNALQAFENQDYQFDMLVSRLGIQPDPGRQTLFDTMFAVHDIGFMKGTPGRGIEGLTIESYPFENNVTQFDIVIHAVEQAENIIFRLLYSTRLYKRETITMFQESFKEVARQVVENRDVSLREIEITHHLTTAETTVPQVEFTF